MEYNADIAFSEFCVPAKVNSTLLQLNEKVLRQFLKECNRKRVGVGVLVGPGAYILPVRGCRLRFFDLLLDQRQQIPVELISRVSLKFCIGLGHLLRDGTQNILSVYKIFFHFLFLSFLSKHNLFVCY